MAAVTSPETSPQPRVYFQTPGGTAEEPEIPVRKQGRVTVKYDRKELRKRLNLEEWIINQLTDLYDCEIQPLWFHFSPPIHRATGEGDTFSRKAHEVIRVRPGGGVQSYVLSGGWGAVMTEHYHAITHQTVGGGGDTRLRCNPAGGCWRQ
ncbi:Protein phosphatase 1 regulatory subunit 14B [Liparis tanakae]|uniref:Protein phosphatase 1 regulatory subunit 14B n=1 Tax=Liparis tanakae TaxID=230148 RepID=A0A4Z2EC36_9TELE|nr:Protein phosphatase 1 regulatory subunit 14B [Liparis tanakae]